MKKQTILIGGGLAGLLFVLLIIFLLTRGGQRTGQPDQTTLNSNELNSNELNQPTDPPDVAPNTPKTPAELWHEKVRSLIHGNPDRIPTSHPQKYHLHLEVEHESSQTHVWSGDFDVRVDAPLSDRSIKRRIFAGPPKEFQLITQQFGTGLLLPNRLVLVSHSFIESATKIQVNLNNQWKTAEIESRTEKDGFALLKLKKGTHPKLPISADGLFDSVRKVNFAWLNQAGELQVERGLLQSDGNTARGGVLNFRRTIREGCIGGVTFGRDGRVNGFVVDSIFPVLNNYTYSQVYPISRIVSNWNQDEKSIRIDNPQSEDSIKPANNEKQQGKKDANRNALEFGPNLVRVLVERTSDKNKKYPVIATADIAHSGSSAPTPIGIYQPADSIERRAAYFVETAPFQIQSTGPAANQIPYYLGSLPDQVLFAFGIHNTSSPIRVTRKGIEFCSQDRSTGIMEFSELELQKKRTLIHGSRRISVSNSSTDRIDEPVKDIVFDLRHEFSLSEKSNLPINSRLFGTIKIGIGSKKQEFKIVLTISIQDFSKTGAY